MTAIADSPYQAGQETILELMRGARAEGATDLHIYARERARIRRGRRLVPYGADVVSEDDCKQFFRHVTGADGYKFLQQEGAVDRRMDGEGYGPVRISMAQAETGMRIFVRLLKEDIASIRELGLPDVIENLTTFPAGLVLLVGPFGSGKTTLQAALTARTLRSEAKHVLSIEDPIEYKHQADVGSITQFEIGSSNGMPSFAAALRKIVRMDFDLGIIGEFRDLESMSTGLELAEKGRLLIGTTHGRDFVGTIDRVIGGFPGDRQQQVRVQLASVLRAIVVLRRIPTIAGDGLVTATEIGFVDPVISGHIADADAKATKQIRGVLEQRKNGNRLLEMSLAELVQSGHISYETARAEAFYPQDLEQYGASADSARRRSASYR